jgi:cysteamine dioxygenase
MGMERIGTDRKGRRKQRKNTAVQILYETCKEVFANCGPDIIPSPTDIERLKAVLDNMTEADVGVKPNMPFFATGENDGPPKITYLHLHECDKFSIGIFCLPPNGVIPLHNHPGMTVFSKILFGTMHIKSYDWVVDGPPVTTPTIDSSDGSESLLRLAKVKVDTDFNAPCSTSILYPAEANMHCFTALTPCAVLDVLGPPYSDPNGRHCSYYRSFPFNYLPEVEKGVVELEDEEKYVWLEEKDKPEGLAVVGALYSGPKILT